LQVLSDPIAGFVAVLGSLAIQSTVRQLVIRIAQFRTLVDASEAAANLCLDASGGDRNREQQSHQGASVAINSVISATCVRDSDI